MTSVCRSRTDLRPLSNSGCYSTGSPLAPDPDKPRPAKRRGRNGVVPRLGTAELYDPATGTFATTGSMGVGRSAHRLTLLQTGNVLIALRERRLRDRGRTTAARAAPRCATLKRFVPSAIRCVAGTCPHDPLQIRHRIRRLPIRLSIRFHIACDANVLPSQIAVRGSQRLRSGTFEERIRICQDEGNQSEETDKRHDLCDYSKDAVEALPHLPRHT